MKQVVIDFFSCLSLRELFLWIVSDLSSMTVHMTTLIGHLMGRKTRQCTGFSVVSSSSMALTCFSRLSNRASLLPHTNRVVSLEVLSFL